MRMAKSSLQRINLSKLRVTVNSVVIMLQPTPLNIVDSQELYQELLVFLLGLNK
jgi:hypothetical protein